MVVTSATGRPSLQEGSALRAQSTSLPVTRNLDVPEFRPQRLLPLLNSAHLLGSQALSRPGLAASPAAQQVPVREGQPSWGRVGGKTPWWPPTATAMRPFFETEGNPMCGRFTLFSSGVVVAEAFELADVPELYPRYNVATSRAMAIFAW